MIFDGLLLRYNAIIYTNPDGAQPLPDIHIDYSMIRNNIIIMYLLILLYVFSMVISLHDVLSKKTFITPPYHFIRK